MSDQLLDDAKADVLTRAKAFLAAYEAPLVFGETRSVNSQMSAMSSERDPAVFRVDELRALVDRCATAESALAEAQQTIAGLEAERDALADAIAPHRHTVEDRECWTDEDGVIDIKALADAARDAGEAARELPYKVEQLKAERNAALQALAELRASMDYIMRCRRDKELNPGDDALLLQHDLEVAQKALAERDGRTCETCEASSHYGIAADGVLWCMRVSVPCSLGNTCGAWKAKEAK